MEYQVFCEVALETLRSVNTMLKQTLLNYSEKFNLTDTQLLVLGFLRQNPNANIGTIATEFDIDCANISPMCKKMERRGFLVRNRSKKDERVVHVSLTPVGEKIVEDGFMRLNQCFAQTFGDIDDGEAEKFLFYLNKFLSSFQEVVEEKC